MAVAPRVHSETAFDLPATQRAATEAFWTDWVYMLEALLVVNAKDGDAGDINIEQNIAIGKIVGALESNSAA